MRDMPKSRPHSTNVPHEEHDKDYLAGAQDWLASMFRPCYALSPMPDLLAALAAFLQEHRRCGELSGGIDSGRVGAVLAGLQS
jgi:hypothetical protein